MNENVTPTGSIGERIKEVIHHYHLTMNSFSLRLKLPSNSVITRVVKDPRRGMSNLTKVKSHCWISAGIMGTLRSVLQMSI